jgi:hypothetical protein
VLESEPQSNVNEIENAIGDMKAAEADVTTAQTDILIVTEGLAPGIYNAYASNLADSLSDTGSDPITVHEIPSVSLGEDIVKCESTEITLDPGPGFNAYLWSAGDVTSQSIMVTTEDDYIVTVTDGNECQNSDTISVRYNIPYQEEKICIVTIDLASGKNIIVWEKTPEVGIVAYNIYRETTIGNYEIIGTTAVTDLSVFLDETGNPESQSYLYKITAMDTCGNQSELANSNYHRPSFLQYVSAEGGINLEWTDYNIESITNIGDYLQSYVIYRGTDSIGLTEYQTVGSINNFTDTDPNALKRKYYYRVAGVLKNSCYPSSGKKYDSGPYSHALSNVEDNRLEIPPNKAPTDISIDNTSINENEPAGTFIGKLSTIDPDTSDTHNYSLVTGEGDTDNDSFNISGDSLFASAVFDYEIEDEYHIRIRTTDASDTAYFEKQFVIMVLKVGIDQPVLKGLEIYPNPFDETTLIRFNNPEEEPYRLILTDLSGKVYRIVDNIMVSEYILEKRDLNTGFYFVELRGTKVYRGKILIE